jgi:hypothetical protein
MKKAKHLFTILIVVATVGCKSTTENISQSTIDVDQLRKMTAVTITFSAMVEEIQMTNFDTTVYKGFRNYILPNIRGKQFLGQLTWDSTAFNSLQGFHYVANGDFYEGVIDTKNNTLEGIGKYQDGQFFKMNLLFDSLNMGFKGIPYVSITNDSIQFCDSNLSLQSRFSILDHHWDSPDNLSTHEYYLKDINWLSPQLSPSLIVFFYMK